MRLSTWENKIGENKRKIKSRLSRFSFMGYYGSSGNKNNQIKV
jgi:hypothetical protein